MAHKLYVSSHAQPGHFPLSIVWGIGRIIRSDDLAETERLLKVYHKKGIQVRGPIIASTSVRARRVEEYLINIDYVTGITDITSQEEERDYRQGLVGAI
ncbi:hypothetical protein AUJ84_01200 [Candidatus Pacearchaeota archaeon CG1_02_32_132]|nr:MAG: hypothetical protein AUJ84_01200 [Candidatus Pacearchaeota archaeon CG1_02_32_132]